MPATYAFLERLLRSSQLRKVCSGLVCVQKCTLFPLSPCFRNAEVSTRGECRPLWNNRVLSPPPPTPHPYHPSTRLPVYRCHFPPPPTPWRATAPLRCIACCYVFNSLNKKNFLKRLQPPSSFLLLLLLFCLLLVYLFCFALFAPLWSSRFRLAKTETNRQTEKGTSISIHNYKQN